MGGGQGAVEDMEMNADFWQRRKRVLVTGHTGFKGAWLALWLQRTRRQGDPATPCLRTPDPVCSPSADVARDMTSRHRRLPRRAIICRTRAATSSPEIVFHLAAQPLVRASYQRARRTPTPPTSSAPSICSKPSRGCGSVRAVVVDHHRQMLREPRVGLGLSRRRSAGRPRSLQRSKACAEIVIAA